MFLVNNKLDTSESMLVVPILRDGRENRGMHLWVIYTYIE